MFLSNPRFILAIVAASSFVGLSSVKAAEVSVFAGYISTTDVSDTAKKDLVQEEFQDILDGGSCEAVEAGLDFFKDSSLKQIPSYTKTKSSTWELYQAYYDDEFYYNSWVEAALKGKKFKSGNVDVDFGKFPGNLGSPDDPEGECVGRQECAKKGTAYVSGYLEIFQFLEEAVNEVKEGCRQQDDGCVKAIDAWNKAAAFWVGSLEGTDGDNSGTPGGGGSYGKQLYALADKRCDDYRTCGPDGNTADRSLPAKVNIVLVSLFQKGAASIYAGDVDSAEKTIKEINSQLTVATIQGTLRYAYRLGQGSDKDKEIAEGATFGAAAFPQLWKCDTRAAEIAAGELEIGSSKLAKKKSNFSKVLAAFQCNYECLGISCDEVGALFDGIEFDAPNSEDPLPQPLVSACEDRSDTCKRLKGKDKKKCKKYTKKPNDKFV